MVLRVSGVDGLCFCVSIILRLQVFILKMLPALQEEAQMIDVNFECNH